MSGSMLSRRLTRLERGAGPTVPLWIQRWLGMPLSEAEQACAQAGWDEQQQAPQPDPASFPPNLRDWLQARDRA